VVRMRSVLSCMRPLPVLRVDRTPDSTQGTRPPITRSSRHYVEAVPTGGLDLMLAAVAAFPLCYPTAHDHHTIRTLK
jgi:hypothetical protein